MTDDATDHPNHANELVEHPIYFDGAFLYDDHLNLCLVQTPPPTSDALLGGSSRPAVVATIRSLLEEHADGSNPRLKHFFGGNQPAMVMLPELSLGLNDWRAVNGLVRNYPSNLILLSGFGFTKGDALTEWLNDTANHDGVTVTKGWPNTAYFPNPCNTYNGGWCWLHTSNGQASHTQCVVFLKHFPNQGHELPAIPNFGPGMAVPIIKTNNLVICPLICSDILYTPDRARSPVDVVTEAVKTHGNGKKALLAGMLYQSDPFKGTWQKRIGQVISGLNGHKFAMALVNQAMDKADTDEQQDSRRNLSGVYVAHNNEARWHARNGARRRVHGPYAAAVLRCTEPLAAAGPVRWDYGPTCGLDIWQAAKCCQPNGGGQLSEPMDFDCACYESRRFIRRQWPAPWPNLPTCASKYNGLAKIDRHLEDNNQPKAPDLLKAICHGLFPFLRPGPNYAVDHDQLHQIQTELERSLECLATLLACHNTRWQPLKTKPGQLTYAHKFNILVWLSPCDNGTKVSTIIKRWAAKNTRPPLLVVLVPGGESVMPSGIMSPPRKWLEPIKPAPGITGPPPLDPVYCAQADDLTSLVDEHGCVDCNRLRRRLNEIYSEIEEEKKKREKEKDEGRPEKSHGGKSHAA